MGTDSDPPDMQEDMSPEEARRYLIRFLGKQDLDEHTEIYEELACE